MPNNSHLYGALERLPRSIRTTVEVLLVFALLIASATPSLAGGAGDILVLSESFWGSDDGNPCPGKKIPGQEIVIFIPPEHSDRDLTLNANLFASADSQDFVPANLNFNLNIEASSGSLTNVYTERFSKGKLRQGQFDVTVSIPPLQEAQGAKARLATAADNGPLYIRVRVDWKKKKKAAGTGLRVAVAPAP